MFTTRGSDLLTRSRYWSFGDGDYSNLGSERAYCAPHILEVTMDDMDIVSALKNRLADRVGRQRFELWFGPNCKLQLTDQSLTVFTPSAFFQRWLSANFRSALEQVCRELLGRCPQIQFVVDPNCQHENHPSADRVTASRRSKEDNTTEQASDTVATAPAKLSEHNDGSQPTGNGRFAIGLETFVVGPSNRLAYASAIEVIRKPGAMSPLTIYGPTGVGKTHLLRGIFHAVQRRYRTLSCMYMSAEQFTMLFLEALRGSGLPNFRRKFRTLDVLIIDDLQFVCGKRCTQSELFYTVEELLNRNCQVVFASHTPPDELRELAPQFLSRLKSGLVCHIDPPEFETRVKIVLRFAAEMELELPREVAEFIASRFDGNVRELSGAVCRLRAVSRAWQEPVTLPLAEKALADLVQLNCRLVQLNDIERAVCQTFGISPKLLHEPGRTARATYPRMLAMWLARKYTRAGLSEISRYFGRRSHSTVISAQRQVDRWLAEGKTIRLADRMWRADEAIRRVEARLRSA